MKSKFFKKGERLRKPKLKILIIKPILKMHKIKNKKFQSQKYTKMEKPKNETKRSRKSENQRKWKNQNIFKKSKNATVQISKNYKYEKSKS